MSRVKLFIFLFFVSKVSSDNLCHTTNITDVGNISGVTSTKENLCKTRACLYRYCQLPDSVLVIWKNGTQKCLAMERVANITGNAQNLTYPNVGYIYKSHNGDLQLSKKGFQDFRNINLINRNVYSKNCSTGWQYGRGHLLEDGSYRMKISNAKQKLNTLEAGKFIMEYTLWETKNGWRKPFMAVKFIKDLKDNSIEENILFFNSIGMLISCFFLLLVVLVYSIFKELRNLSGMIVMAYAASFTLSFLVKAVQIMLGLKTRLNNFCEYTSIIIYFGLMASFFWMNVLSFDIWWTFQGTIKLRQINRRGILHKFLMYCLYAFGFPLLLTIIAYVIDNADLGESDVIKPRFESCLYAGKDNFVIFLYIYVPMIIFMAANTVLFLMTCYNIWWLKRDIQRTYKNNKSLSKNRSRFVMYLRLFMIMGINWILEIISNRVEYPIILQYIVNGYNVLIGIFIFIIFVCNRKVARLLRKRYPNANKYVSTFQSAVSRRTSTQKKNMSSKMDNSASVAIGST